MKYSRIMFVIVALSLTLLISCNDTGVTQPAVNPDVNTQADGDLDRFLEWGGYGGGGGPYGPGGWGWWEPDPGFEVDCERTFDVEYSFESPDGYEFVKEGQIVIMDEDCDAEESDVFVEIGIGYGGYFNGGYMFSMYLDGTKTTTDEGLLYSGETTYENSGWFSYEMTREFELLVFEADDETLMEGWYTRTVSFSWSSWGGDEWNFEHEWTIDISGVEVY